MTETISDKIIDYFSPRTLVERKKARLLSETLEGLSNRSYDGASYSHRLKNWYTPRTSANVETKISKFPLRDRARDLVRNNPYASRAINVIVNNTVGAGIVPQIRCKNDQKRLKIEALWSAWANTSAIDQEGRHLYHQRHSFRDGRRPTSPPATVGR